MALPTDSDNGIRNWLVAERILRQISFQKDMISIDEGTCLTDSFVVLTLFSDDLFSLENLLLTVEQEAKELPLKFQIENQESSLVDLKKKVNLA